MGEIELGVADAVGGDLEEVFEEGDAPADECGDELWAGVLGAEVAVPGVGHEAVREGEEQDGLRGDFGG